jgi:putative glutamine amidotransferase
MKELMKNDELKIGISYTDWRFDEYVSWLKTDSTKVEVIVLSYEMNNIQDLERCDRLILSGGKDVNPEIYVKADQINLCGKLLPKRDDFEIKLINTALEKKIPILGICRGHQIVNVSPIFGGSLHCDIPSIQNSKCLEHSNELPLIARHEIEIEKDTLMFEIMGSEKIDVNSFHHQSVDKVGKGLRVSSHAPDGIVESLEWVDKEKQPKLILVQWHPERLVEEKSSKLLLDYFYNKITTKRN